MKKFIRLLSFEMNRFLKFLVPALLIAAAVQLFVTVSSAITYNNELEKYIAMGDSLDQVPTFSIQNVTGSNMYELSIFLIITIFMVYSFFTWYREWLGKNTFIYRLLMLPMNRSAILFSKAGVFLIGGLLAFVFQFGMYFIQIQILDWLITDTHYLALNIHNANSTYALLQPVLFPTSLFEFVDTYSFAFGALFSLFAGILIERSFGLKGLITGALYFLGYFIGFAVLEVFLSTADFSVLLRPSHIQMMILAYQFIMIGLGTAISCYLLKNKVKV